MKTKFAKSNIEISGNIWITTHHPQKGFEPVNNEEKIFSIGGSKGKTKSGVYELVNKLNGKRYIGQARNLEIRYNRHMRDLIKHEHCNELIQIDYDNTVNEWIIDNDKEKIMTPYWLFEFKVIIYCRPSELTFWEHILIENLHPEYNIKKEKELNISDYPDSEILDDILEDQKEFDSLEE